MPVLNISQSEFELESRFEPRLWALHRDVPELYEALLTNLGPSGLSSVDLRPDAGDGSVGGRVLAFFLFAFNANVRIGLESLRFRFTSLARVERAAAIQAIGGVMASVAQVSRGAAFTNHTIVYSCHGQIIGTPATEFIRQFVTTRPKVDGFGENLTAGTALYYGEAPPVLSSVLTLDPSRAVEGGLFVRILLVVDGAPRPADELAQLAMDRIHKAFTSLALEVEPWS